MVSKSIATSLSRLNIVTATFILMMVGGWLAGQLPTGMVGGSLLAAITAAGYFNYVTRHL